MHCKLLCSCWWGQQDVRLHLKTVCCLPQAIAACSTLTWLQLGEEVGSGEGSSRQVLVNIHHKQRCLCADTAANPTPQWHIDNDLHLTTHRAAWQLLPVSAAFQ